MKNHSLRGWKTSTVWMTCGIYNPWAPAPVGAAGLAPAAAEAVSLAGFLANIEWVASIPGVFRVHLFRGFRPVEKGAVQRVFVAVRKTGAEFFVRLLQSVSVNLDPSVLIRELGIASKGVKIFVHEFSFLVCLIVLWYVKSRPFGRLHPLDLFIYAYLSFDALKHIVIRTKESYRAI